MDNTQRRFGALLLTAAMVFSTLTTTALATAEPQFQPQTIDLERASVMVSVSGRVVDINGQSLPYAVVTIGSRTATTDEQGVFTITELEGDSTYSVQVVLKGYELASPLDAEIHLGNADITDHIILMQAISRKVTGTVVSDGVGLKGATVTLVSANEPYTVALEHDAVTDSNGAYILNVDSVTAGSYRVRAAKAGYGATIGESPVTIQAIHATETVEAAELDLMPLNLTNGYIYDMSDENHSPAYETPGSINRPAVRLEHDSLFMNFSSTDKSDNIVRILGPHYNDVTVEFDATRNGTGEGGFGILLRQTDLNNYFFVGQGGTNGTWLSENKDRGMLGQSEIVTGPSFAAGETRHFKATIRQDGSMARVSLWIDGIQVMKDTTAGDSGAGPNNLNNYPRQYLSFTSGSNNTQITVRNLYIFREDPSYIVTVPEDGSLLLKAMIYDGKLRDVVNGIVFEGEEVRFYNAREGSSLTGLTVSKSGEPSVQVPVSNNSSAEPPYRSITMPGYNVTALPTLSLNITGIALDYVDSEGPTVGKQINASLLPAEGTGTVTWYRERLPNTESWAKLTTGNAYTPVANDGNKRLKVEAKGTGVYSGTVSQVIGPVTAPVTGVAFLSEGDVTEPLVINGVGRTISLTAEVTPSTATDLSLVWTSSDESVATVEGQPTASTGDDRVAATASATVTGRKEGTTTITVTNPASGLSDSRTVQVGIGVTNVIFADPSDITLYTNGKNAQQGNTVTLTAVVRPENASIKKLRWWSSDPTVATVDDNGIVTAVSSGTARIHVCSEQNTQAAAYRNVTVITVPEHLTLNITHAEFSTNSGDDTHEITVIPSLFPVDTSDQTIIWTTSDPAVATVRKPWASSTGNQNALITAQGIGTATITAASAADNSVLAHVTVAVHTNIVGQVAVDGDAKIGSTLTANINDIIEGAKDDLAYQWYRGQETTDESAIPGATSREYVLTKEDLGFIITVKATAHGDYRGETSASTTVITKADGLAMRATPTFVNCTAEGVNDGKITGLFKGRKYEYKLLTESDAAWRPFSDMSDDETGSSADYGTAEITGLAPGSYHVRRAEDDTHFPGPFSSTITIVVEGGQEILLNIPRRFEGGVVRANRRQIPVNDTVTLWVVPDNGYHLTEGSLKVSYLDANGIEGEAVVTAMGNDTYTFLMPAFEATVTAAFEKNTYTIGHALTNIVCDMEEHSHTAIHGERFSITLAPEDGYDMPRSITITATDSGVRFTDYTYVAHPSDPSKRVLTFEHGVTQNVTITANGTLKAFPVEYVRERVSFLTAPTSVSWHKSLTAAIAADPGYQLPAAISVTINGQPIVHTYNPETGAVYIPEEVIDGPVRILVCAEKIVVPVEKVSISGTAQVGQRLTANITPANADGHVTYQWYWLEADGTELPIPGATGRSRVVTEESLGKAIKVKVTALEGHDFSGSAVSEPTGTVIAAAAETISPQWVTLNHTETVLERGDIMVLVAQVGPSAATNKTIFWRTDNSAVATVENGVVTAIGPGNAVITVTTEDGEITAECAVTVIEPKIVQATAEDVLLTYDGQAHGISVIVTRPSTGATITYSSDGSHFNSQPPTFSAVGEHPVWYAVSADGLEHYIGQAKVVINQAIPEVHLTATPSSLSGAGLVTLSVAVPSYADVSTVTIASNDPSLSITQYAPGLFAVQLPATAVRYTFTAYLPGTENYAETTATCLVTVSSGGGGGGGNGGGNGEIVPLPDSETITTETREDGSKVTTVTKPDGSKTETVERPDGSKSVTEITKNGDVTITTTDADGEQIAKVELPAKLPESTTRFEDVSEEHWADEAIHRTAALKLVEGVGNNKFDPNAPMTRGQLATILHRLSQGKTDYDVTFEDVADDMYYTAGVAWAAKAGVVKGFTAEIFAPEQVITREQFAVMMTRYAKLIGQDTTANIEVLNIFSDADKAGSWAVDGVAWCVKVGILQGKGNNTLDPTANVTRAEVALMLDRFIALLK